MAIYSISDLHLSLRGDKPMDIFGQQWHDHHLLIEKNWNLLVKQEDIVLLPGDISWETYLDGALLDFNFIEKLPGRKIISKGNHDYWWTTTSKLNNFFDVNNLRSISILQNNSYIFENIGICGTRGWNCPGDYNFSKEDEKIYLRELNRLELSLQSLKSEVKEIIVMIHYPTVNWNRDMSGFIEIMKRYGVAKCLYGHLHGNDCNKYKIEDNLFGIEHHLVSCDYLGFAPKLIYP